MSLYLLIAVALFVLLIGYAVYKRENVRASFSLKPFGFSLEAKTDKTRKDEK